MNDIAGYRIEKQLFSSVKTLVYQAFDPEGDSVILKTITEQCLSNKQLALFNSEYKINSLFSTPLIAKTIQLTNHGNIPVMVLEDIGGFSLKEIMKNNAPGYFSHNLESSLDLAILIIKAIAEIHDKNVIHKDINPSNIVINQNENRLNIIDFGLSTELSYENFDLANINLIEGSLAYISPEQTGRINRKIDYRTDYYSFGITLYELFSGQLPFNASNAREWVYCHIAREPVPLADINDKIPVALSKIVAKLIEKTAEMRYQSPYAIVNDLLACRDALKRKKIIPDFVAGKNDISRKFQISQKLYGREKEIELMLSAFNKLPVLNTFFISVKGRPGVGKSSLVGELYRPIIEKNGYFISGKFEQFKKDIPYFAFISAFTKLIQTILTESETVVARWKKKMLEALSGNAHLIIELIPELELLLGSQPVPTELSSMEAHNRFVLTFQKLVDLFANENHPLVMFIDDLQWADHASLDLLKVLLANQSKRAFLCIGAYRHNEISAGHPLTVLLDTFGKANINTLEIDLKALEPDKITELIADSFHCSPTDADELAAVCHHKTNGNPFFLNAFLLSLYKSKIIWHNSKKGHWEWDIDQIRKSGITNNVIDLICNRIRELSENTQHALKQASCIGSSFTIETLSIISEKSKNDLVLDLKPALSESLILPLSENYRFAEFDINPNIEYKFIHDRVLQATYSLIEGSSKEIAHLKIARLLLKSYSKADVAENIFTLVEHFNKAINLLNKEESTNLSELNLIAAQKARASSAFRQAFSYLSIGLLLINDECWTSNYQHALQIHSLMAEIALLCAEHDKMIEMIDKVKVHANSSLDQVDIYETHLLALSFDHHYPMTIYEGVRMLKKFHVSIPEKAGLFNILHLLIKTWFALRRTNPEKITKLPLISNPEAQAALRIMGMLITPSYYANPLLFPVLAFQFVRLTLRFGLSPIAPLGFVIYGMILNTVLGKIDPGFQYGKLGIKLLDKVKDRKYWANTSTIYHATLSSWKEPIKETTKGFMQDYQAALETGNIEYATTSIAICLSYKIFEGVNLNELLTTFNDYDNFLNQWPQQPNTHLLKVFLQTVLNLQNLNSTPANLTGEKCDENEIIREAMFVKDYAQMASLHVNKLMLAYLFENLDQGLIILHKLKKWIKNITNLLQYPIYVYYSSLLQLALYQTYSATRKVVVLREIKQNLKKLKKWANHVPMNFLNKYYLVTAEMERVKGNVKEAIINYNRAISLARKQTCLVDEALGFELFGKFCLENGVKESVGFYFSKAIKTYEIWGATAKVEQLSGKYSKFVSTQTTFYQKNDENLTTTTTSLSVSGSISLDIETLMDAAKTISSEIVLPELIKKIIGIILQHAGAQKGMLLLRNRKSGDLMIMATGVIVGGEQQITLMNHKISEENLPLTVIRFVSHKMQSLIIANAANDEGFMRDSYINEQQLKSVLVMPLIHQAKLVGIIYLENNLATNVFTSHHLTVLNLLSSQIGISIENAFLYENLEEKVAERTEQIKIQSEELKSTNQKLIELDQFKEGMTAMIVHDLKNPLNTILNSSNEPETKQVGKQMLNMVLNILDIQKFESAQMKIHALDFSLNSCVLEALQQVKILSERKSIKLEIKMLGDLTVKGDFDLINRVFVNILTNAIKHTPNNGKIEILAGTEFSKEQISHLQRIDIGNNDAPFYIVRIVDSGHGIPSDKLNSVFDKFSQIESKSYGGVRSTGLGLTFCKLAIEAHGGEIGVESELGSGSMFWFLLPKGKTSSTTPKVEETQHDETYQLTNEDMIYLSVFQRELTDYTVYEFSDIDKILKKIENKNENIRLWKKEFENVVRACNVDKYNDMINSELQNRRSVQ